jgi:hypothetical protein
MTQPRPSGSPVPSAFDVRRRISAIATPPERRDFTRRGALVRRITAEFCEMPGLVLSIAQASRLLGVDAEACERIFATLQREGLLRRRVGGGYGLA